MATYVLSIVLIASFAFVDCKQLPKDFPVCKRSRDDFKTCLTDAINTSIKFMQKSNPDLDLPELEVIHMGTIKAATPTNRNLQIEFQLANITLYDYAKLNILNTEFSLTDKNLKLTIKSRVPQFIINGTVSIKGQLFVIPLDVTGLLKATLFETDIVTLISGKVIKKDGKSFLDITFFSSDVTPNDIKVDLRNLFDDATFEEALNRVFNQNWRELYAELGNSYFSVFDDFFKSVATKIFDKVPLDDIFPD